jgi:hypothetical protein
VEEVLFVVRRENIDLIVYVIEACVSSGETGIWLLFMGELRPLEVPITLYIFCTLSFPLYTVIFPFGSY